MKKCMLLACLVLLSVLWACDDDTATPTGPTEPTTTELIAGESSKTWRIDALAGTISLNGTPLLTIDLLNPPASLPALPVDFNCLTDNEFTFFTDHTFTATEGTVTCADTLSATASGTWGYTESGTTDPDTLTIGTTDNLAIPTDAPLPIESLTATEMISSYTFVLDSPVTITTPFPVTIEEVDVKVTLVNP